MNSWSNHSRALSISAFWPFTGIWVLARDGYIQGQDHFGSNGSKGRLSMDVMEAMTRAHCLR